MPLVATKYRFKWSTKNLRYRDLKTGRWVSSKAVKADVLRVENAAGRDMQRLSEQLINREITLTQWQDNFAEAIKNLHTSGAMAGAGGINKMTQADYGRLGQELRFQYSRLDRFARQIEEGKVSKDQLRARVRMYVAAINKTYEAVRRGRAVGVYMYERNVLSKTYHDRHCQVCKDQTARGRVIIGSLIPPGQRTCLANCKCRLVFSGRIKNSI